MKDPLVSIITVVFNNENTILDAVKSVLNQSYKNIEYIIIDGKSTDNTLKKLEPFSKKIHKIISEKDSGIYDAMNKGLTFANGEIIGILNSDDFYLNNNVIKSVVDAFDSKTDIVYGNLFYVDQFDTNKIVRKWKSSQFKKGSFSSGWHPPHPSFFVKKKMYENLGNFNINLKIAADFELMLRFMENKNSSSFFLNKYLVKMRLGGESNLSLRNVILGHKNFRESFKLNNIKPIPFYSFFRIISKLKQYI
jgi:glycosyltransferase involved in cell wall biosynthesis